MKLLYKLKITYPVTRSFTKSFGLDRNVIPLYIQNHSFWHVFYIDSLYFKCFLISKNCCRLSIYFSTCMFPYLAFAPMDSLSLCLYRKHGQQFINFSRFLEILGQLKKNLIFGECLLFVTSYTLNRN